MGKRQRKGRRRLVGGCRHYFLFPPQLSTVFLPTAGVVAAVSPVSARRPGASSRSPGHRSALSGRWCLFVVELYPMSCLTCQIGSWLLAFLSRLPKVWCQRISPPGRFLQHGLVDPHFCAPGPLQHQRYSPCADAFALVCSGCQQLQVHVRFLHVIVKL